MTSTDTPPGVGIGVDLGTYQPGRAEEEESTFGRGNGIDEVLIREMSWRKSEPKWMLDFRLMSFDRFERRPMPDCGAMGGIELDEIRGDVERKDASNDDRDVVSESEVVYRSNREDLEAQGVLFCDMDAALREYPELVREYFGAVVAPDDNKFSALNSAVWSGGSFVHVPPGVEVEMPLQAYFGISAEHRGQFERTLIVAEEGSTVHYIEGCSAPTYTADSLRAAVVEIVVKPSARVTHTTMQNWSDNVHDLVTTRAYVEAEGHVKLIDGTIGSRLTMKYPAVVLAGPRASGEVTSVAYAGPGQHHDTGAKMTHAAPETTSKIVAKSISNGGGRTSHRRLVRVEDEAYGCRSHARCDALILDDESMADTYPSMEIGSGDAVIDHDVTVSEVADAQLFYLQSRGLTEAHAVGVIVNGFIEPFTRTLPTAYAVEWSRLIELQMEGSVG